MKYQTAPPPQTLTFQEMNLAPHLLPVLENMKITQPTTIQCQAIPIVMKGAEAIIVAQTGSGKTLAYVLPIITTLLQKPDARALVLAPSREVAAQIHRVFEELLAGHPVRSALIIGGTPNKEQVSLLKKIPRVIVATPGRLNDHLLTNKLLLQKVGIVVIDEADRMLDMGFAPQLKNIRKTMRGTWQTLMVSASFGQPVEEIAQKFMSTEPFLVRTLEAEKPVIDLEQRVYFLDRSMKNDLLARELSTIKGGVLVFAGNQPNCEKVGQFLKDNGFSSDYIHGGLNPGHRNRVMREFREQKIQIMITTDLLARGLDVAHIKCVVNYDLPYQPEDFLHRIGRTARVGRFGRAITFVTPGDREMYLKIKGYLQGAEEFRR